MDRFLVITNERKDKDNIITKQIADYIISSGRKCNLIGSLELEGNKIRPDIDAQCAIVLGGDGTIIRCATHLMELNIPILGINLGTIGFLAEIEKNHIKEAIDSLFVDDYVLENRMMIRGDLRLGAYHKPPNVNGKLTTGYALNDIVITRKGLSRIISIRIYVNNELVDDYRGDGVIISTPTGSTAYNLSAGGPIITPKADVMVITPICPHSLSPRSVVVSAEDVVKVVVRRSKKTQNDEAIATFDGQKVIDLGTEDEILIKKAQYNTKLIKLSRTGIYEILRSKLTGSNDL
ncbi:MAG: NAD(+)/NADH kinase [Clostridiales bacterium]|jgi:NAD+ kinase|nr:NAD(+)/NADH kinase [Clostridiales bacterium]